MRRSIWAGLALAAAAVAGPSSAQTVQVTSTASPYPIQSFEIAPDDNRFLRVIGLYEAGGRFVGDDPNIPFDANVVIDDQLGAELFLVFSAYDPVRWNLTGAGVGAVRGVLLNGYSVQSFTGIDSALVTNLSPIPASVVPCTYSLTPDPGSCPAPGPLIEYASALYGERADSFTGTYSANGFLIQAGPSAVPEPASWALMIGGFGLAGAAVRRQRRHAV